MNGWGGIIIKLLIICRSIRKVSGLVSHRWLVLRRYLSTCIGKYLLEREKLVKENAWVLDE
jgi:hypothetical protein